METQATLLFTTNYWQRMMRQAVDEFARTHWPKPRKAGPINQEGQFQMAGGTATYIVKAGPHGDIDVWEIWRL